MPEIGQIIDNPFAHGELSFAARYRLARQLAKADYQSAYVLLNSLKSALIPFLAGIPERIGFTGESRYGLINRRHTLDKIALPLMAERFAQLAEPVGAPLPRPLPFPHLDSSLEQQDATLAALNIKRPGEGRCLLPRRRIWPGQALAGTLLREPCRRTRQPRLRRLAAWLGQRPSGWR